MTEQQERPAPDASQRLTISVAMPPDLDTVLTLLRSASAARATPGLPGWGEDFPDVERDLPAGLVYLARLGGEPAGTFVLRWSDHPVWGLDDGDAGYLHRLATAPAFAGQGLGARLVAAAEALVRSQGGRWLRLDTDRDNARLRAWYEGLGFRHAGDTDMLKRVTGPGYRWASRYQRDLSGTGSDSNDDSNGDGSAGGTGNNGG